MSCRQCVKDPSGTAEQLLPCPALSSRGASRSRWDGRRHAAAHARVALGAHQLLHCVQVVLRPRTASALPLSAVARHNSIGKSEWHRLDAGGHADMCCLARMCWSCSCMQSRSSQLQLTSCTCVAGLTRTYRKSCQDLSCAIRRLPS